MSVRDEFLLEHHRLKESLKVLGPDKHDPGKIHGDEAARQLAYQLVLNVFGVDSPERIPEAKMSELLPELTGARKIVDALYSIEVRYPLPILHQIVVEASKVWNRIKNPTLT